MNKTFTLKRKLKFCLVLLLMATFLIAATPKTYAAQYDEYNRLAREIQDKVDDGILPDWHATYKEYVYYHLVYQKYNTSESSLEYFANMSEDDLRAIFNRYLKQQMSWDEVFKHMELDIREIEPNKTIGTYFNGTTLYLIWSSEYIPNELLNLYEVRYEVNGVQRILRNDYITNSCAETNGDTILDGTTHVWVKGDVYYQLNVTPIMYYHECDEHRNPVYFGTQLNDAKKFKILGWTAEIDRFWKTDVDDPEGYYTFSTDKAVEFELTDPIEYDGKAVTQFTTHRFVNITDAVAQSVYDLNFGGYKHYVYFNTDLDLDDVYRVDVSYELKADDEIWLKKLLTAPKDQRVVKSLSKESNAGGLFNLTNYYGLTIGEFKSNEKDTKTYKYRLMLNYDESNWSLKEILPVAEADYKRIQKFFIFRLNFVYEDAVYDKNIKMDTINGNTLHFYDRDQILDSTSAFYEFKENTYEVTDKVEDVVDDVSDVAGSIWDKVVGVVTGKDPNSSKIMKTILISGGCVLGVLGLYYVAKIVGVVGKVFKKKDDD